MIMKELLRGLPKVDPILESKIGKELTKEFTRERVKLALRDSLSFYRDKILKKEIINIVDEKEIIDKAKSILKDDFKSSLKRVINATGIVIHTNLGRSVLSKKSVDAVCEVAKNYSNLEYNLKEGQRGSRYSHIEGILNKLIGTEAALVVNNNAAAVMLILNEIARGKEAVISRGELVEIGGSFRIPDVMEYSGAILKEVGATNRTHTKDYENAINENTGVLLKVHSSNYKIIGFTKEVTSKELAQIGKENNIITYEDLGSGVLINLPNILNGEKTVKDSVEAGIDIVSFSGDKMLGGPQAGIIVGKKTYIDKLKNNPLTRALRVDKFTLAALEATLLEYLKEETVIENIPTLGMITESLDSLKVRAEGFIESLSKMNKYKFNIKEDVSFVGGGSMPEQELKTYVIEIDSKLSSNELEKRLRDYKIPVIVRISKDKVLLDIRTIRKEEYSIIVDALEEVGVI
ncbi:L-seryl-tRNA(Sec) selenium transferase [uncultured Clostridium sp.]|uniref:L-seryl-tRNA(Sec) selenium transferase n=1 Tax=uncultured Clostridium sp. TaxID=59620 RepID=UPI00261BFF81|nr:L-seryl-tRNA(Sec) selenium transferase [uncultured Clostridium sp.]